MNYVFEKALLSLLFYNQNHYFFAHEFQNFYPFPFSTFLWKGTWKPFNCSLVLAQPRKTHLDMTESYWQSRIESKQTNIIISYLKDSECLV